MELLNTGNKDMKCRCVYFGSVSVLLRPSRLKREIKEIYCVFLGYIKVNKLNVFREVKLSNYQNFIDRQGPINTNL